MYSAPSLRSALRAIEAALAASMFKFAPGEFVEPRIPRFSILVPKPERKTLSTNARIERAFLLGD